MTRAIPCHPPKPPFRVRVLRFVRRGPSPRVAVIALAFWFAVMLARVLIV